jgi:anaerobic magnesium-protoporphyrin IX monomethyl ester cyclase
MKVVLVRPPSILGDLRRTTSLHHPIGLALLAAVLEQAGHQSEIVDYEVMPLDAELILRHSPDVVGITAMTPTVSSAYGIAAKLKSFRHDLPVVLGGVHATLLPERSLEESGGCVDVAVIGEGEKRLPRVLDALAGKTAFEDLEGAAWRSEGQIRSVPRREWVEDLDALPFPDRDKIRMDLYDQTSSPGFSRRFLRITEIFTSRGCTYDCIFCSAALLSGKRIRRRSIGKVIEEMELCAGKYGIQHFTISDDNFAFSTDRVRQFCDKAARLGVTWTCETRVNSVDRDLLERMSKAGCRKVSFGIETASPEGMMRVQKKLHPEEIENAFAWARKAGITRAAFFQVGVHPDETAEDIFSIEKLLRRIDPDYLVVSLATPYPGTELRRLMAERNFIFSDDWTQYRAFTDSPVWRTALFSPEQLVLLQRRLIRRFYFHPRRILRHFLSIRSFGEFLYAAAAAFSLLRLTLSKRVATPKI